MKTAWSMIALALLVSGCADMKTPTVKEAMSRPLGTGASFTLGTQKAAVLEAWGQPDYVVALGKDELGNPREEWVYRGRIPAVPVDYEYVSRNKHLFFEGENMVRSETE